MNISNSVSQILFTSQISNKNALLKAYIWPEYNAGKITKIQEIKPRSHSEVSYIKRSSYDLTRKNAELKSLHTSEYNGKGDLYARRSDYIPGSIFEAIA